MNAPPVRRRVQAGANQLSYVECGPVDGPVVVLLHGLASDACTWDRALPALAARGVHAVAVDLLGHGESDKPDGSYLLEDFAQSLTAFLDAVEIDRAVLCGHSLGGAIAMLTASRIPLRCRGLVLVSAGGLGREVHPLLRAASLRVAPRVLAGVTGPRLRRIYAHPRTHRVLGLTPDNVANLRRAGRALGSDEGRRSFFASLRGVIAPGGQRGSFIAMDLLSSEIPTLLVWNAHDPVIPVSHARAARAHLPGSRLVVFPGGGHEPHRREPDWFADEVAALAF